MLDLHKKVLFASENAHSGLKYNKELVQSQYFQSIVTGLSNDNIRAEMRMYLQDEKSSDEVLQQKMQIAQYNESERAQKTRSTTKTSHRASLNLVEWNEDEYVPLTYPVSAKPSKPTKENPLLTKIEERNTAIRELTGQVASLLQTVQHQRKSDDNSQTKTPTSVFKTKKTMCSMSAR